MKKFLILLCVVAQSLFAQAPKELKTIFEVAGQDSGALLGYYVKGVGDLNKDGYADVAVSAPGQLKTYIYYGGKTMSQTPSLTLQGGGAIASGDFNGDGWIDLAIYKIYQDTVMIYFGKSTMDSIPDKILAGKNFGDNGFGYNLAVGDINGDGFDDLIASGSDTANRGKVYIFAGGLQIDTVPKVTLLGDTLRAGLGWDFASGDINKDGKKDIVALGYNQLSFSGNDQYYYLSIFLGDSAFQLKRNYYIDSRNVPGGFKSHVACFDADGDGIDDILVNKIYIFKGGTHLDTLPTYYVAPPNNDTSNFGSYPWVSGGGDFNRDGAKDILVSSTQGYFGGVPGVFLMLDRKNHPGQYVAYRVYTDYWTESLDGRPENAGDVNGDGIDDIIIGGPDAFLHQEGIFGIYSGDTSLVTTVENGANSRPESFELNQNFPNPFNPSTVISYQLSASSKVVLKIYDSLGRIIATLVNEQQAAGKHTVLWNGVDENGNHVSSGVYYYQLIIPSGAQAKKAILIK